MIGIERADKSKKHKASVEAAINSINMYVQGLSVKYNNIWNQLEKNRKQRAELIEEIIKTLKENAVKTNIPLGKCDNRELNIEVESVLSKLRLTPKELVQCNLIKINNRFDSIEKLGKELHEIALEISKIRVPEADLKDEIILDFSKIEEKKQEENQTVIEEYVTEEMQDENELDEVIGITGSSLKLNESLDNDLGINSIDDNTVDIDTVVERSLEDLMDEYKSSIQVNNDDCISYEIKDGESFLDVNEKMYEGQVPWNALLVYGDNEVNISKYASENNMKIYDVICDKHALAGLSISIPVEIKFDSSDIDMTSDNSYGKVA